MKNQSKANTPPRDVKDNIEMINVVHIIMLINAWVLTTAHHKYSNTLLPDLPSL